MTAGCEQDKIYLETFQPSATYTAVDLNQPSVARASFQTTATGTPVAPTVTYGAGKGRSEVGKDIVGSLALRGTLDATVAPGGAPSLTRAGKAVTALASGRYRLRITDRDAKHGLMILGPKSTASRTLTGTSFVGRRTVTVSLTPGRWTYYTSLASARFLLVAA